MSTIVTLIHAAQHAHQFLMDPTPTTPGPPGPVLPSDIPVNTSAPGASTLSTFIGDLKLYSLMISLIGLIISTMALAGGRWFSNTYATASGRSGVLLSMSAAVLVGGGSWLIQWAFGLGNSWG